MPEKSYSEFMLEVSKVFIWPILIVAGAFWLGDDFREILKSRTWKLGGLIEVGGKVSNLQETLQEELLLQKDLLNEILSNSADSDKVRQAATKALNNIGNTQKGVKKEIQNIQQSIPQALIAAPRQLSAQSTRRGKNLTDSNSARDWEAQGFQHLISRNLVSSIGAFSEAEKIWPDYHNVAEIRQLLINNKEALEAKESPKWKELYQKILSEFSWGMPQDIRQKMQNYVEQ